MVMKTNVKRIIGFILAYGFIFGLCYFTDPESTIIESMISSLAFIGATLLIVGFCLLLIWLFTSK
jgi:hypothetical protein